MTIWMIGSRYDDNGNLSDYPIQLDEANAAYGYFTSEEEAKKKAELLMEPLNSGYLEYVAHSEADDEANQRRYTEEMVDFEILKAAGRTPHPPYKIYLTKIQSFDQWHTMRFAAIEVSQGSLDINEIL